MLIHPAVTAVVRQAATLTGEQARDLHAAAVFAAGDTTWRIAWGTAWITVSRIIEAAGWGATWDTVIEGALATATWDPAVEGIWGTATWDTVGDGGGQGVLTDATRDAVAGAVTATLLRDRLADDQYATLTTPWHAIFPTT